MSVSIVDVISWKFNNQPGMVCQSVNGTVQITEFPGGVPSQVLQDQWTAEYQTWIAGTGPIDSDCDSSIDLSKMNKLNFEVNFNQENRIRVLEAKPAVTRQQYRDALKVTWRTL